MLEVMGVAKALLSQLSSGWIWFIKILQVKWVPSIVPRVVQDDFVPRPAQAGTPQGAYGS